MKTLATSLALAALAFSSAGCAARMKLDPRLAEGAEAYDVTGANPRVWGKPIAFGPWRASAVKDGTTTGWSFEVLGLGGLAKKARPYGLRLEGPAGAMDAECLQQSLEALAPFGVTVDPDVVTGRPILACGFRPAGAAGGDWSNAWTLVLRATGKLQPAYEGELRNARGVSYAVRSVHALEGGAIPAGTPAGFALDRGATAAAAVEVLNAGRVLVSRRESDAFALAAASAALLLFQPN